jgi:hypothetical protein
VWASSHSKCFSFYVAGATARAAAAGVIKQAIERKRGSEIGVKNADEFSGESLIYGILLSSRCLLPDTADRKAKPSAKAS